LTQLDFSKLYPLEAPSASFPIGCFKGVVCFQNLWWFGVTINDHSKPNVGGEGHQQLKGHLDTTIG